MRTILAIAALFIATACQSGGGYDGPPPFHVPTNWHQQAPTFGPVMTCTRLGAFINCY